LPTAELAECVWFLKPLWRALSVFDGHRWSLARHFDSCGRPSKSTLQKSMWAAVKIDLAKVRPHKCSPSKCSTSRTCWTRSWSCCHLLSRHALLPPALPHRQGSHSASTLLEAAVRLLRVMLHSRSPACRRFSARHLHRRVPSPVWQCHQLSRSPRRLRHCSRLSCDVGLRAPFRTRRPIMRPMPGVGLAKAARVRAAQAHPWKAYVRRWSSNGQQSRSLAPLCTRDVGCTQRLPLSLRR